MKNYKYSIIIPHKNIPDLLTRCVASIPQRNDVQIIVVDDNSDPSIVDFDNFPIKNGENTIVVLNKTNRGTGGARNIGMEKASGEKIIIVDADDYFNYWEISYLLKNTRVAYSQDCVFATELEALTALAADFRKQAIAQASVLCRRMRALGMNITTKELIENLAEFT